MHVRVVNLLLCLLLTLSALPALGVGLPAGTQICLVATASFLNDEDQLVNAEPASLTLVVQRVAGVDLVNTDEPERAVPGQDLYIPVTIINTGNAADVFVLRVTSAHRWQADVVYDDNADGIHQEDEQWVVNTAGPMVADGYTSCFVRISVPEDATSDTVTLTAASSYNAASTDQLQFSIGCADPPIVAIASPTDQPTYTAAGPTVDLAGTASGELSITEVTWATDHGTSGTCTGTTDWTATAVDLQAGANIITITATDSSSRRASDTLTVTYTPDPLTPTIRITSPTSSSTFATNSATISLGGTASDSVGLQAVAWSNDRGGSGACSGTSAWTASGITLFEGDNVITVTATSSSGLTASDTCRVTYQQEHPPVVAITSPTTNPSCSTGLTIISIAGTASHESGISSVTWSNLHVGSGSCTGTTEWSATGLLLKTGTNVITVTATSTEGDTATDTLTVVCSAPSVTITSPTTAATYMTQRVAVNLAGKASGGVASVYWSSNRGFSGTCSGTTSWTAKGIPMLLGQNVITVTASDGSGNGDYSTLTITRYPDVTKPKVAITSPTSEGHISRNCPVVSISGTASDNANLSSVVWTNTTTGATASCTVTGTTWSAAGIALVVGDNEIVATATDATGNTATAALTVTYLDIKPGTAWLGMAMVSLPVIPDKTDPKLETGFASTRWCAYLPEEFRYAVYPDTRVWFTPADETPGRGFWGRFDSIAVVPYGTIPAQDRPATIHLKRGWNLVGTPFISPVRWDASQLMIQVSGESAIPMADARNITTGIAWGWRQDQVNPLTGAYFLVADASVRPDAVHVLEPWRGYWVSALRDCDLIIPPPP